MKTTPTSELLEKHREDVYDAIKDGYFLTPIKGGEFKLDDYYNQKFGEDGE